MSVLISNDLLNKLEDLQLFIHDWPGMTLPDLYRRLPYTQIMIDAAIQRLISEFRIYKVSAKVALNGEFRSMIRLFCRDRKCRVR